MPSTAPVPVSRRSYVSRWGAKCYGLAIWGETRCCLTALWHRTKAFTLKLSRIEAEVLIIWFLGCQKGGQRKNIGGETFSGLSGGRCRSWAFFDLLKTNVPISFEAMVSTLIMNVCGAQDARRCAAPGVHKDRGGVLFKDGRMSVAEEPSFSEGISGRFPLGPLRLCLGHNTL